MLFFKKKKKQNIAFFTNRFVDIHSHLLPGIDDGAKNIDNSIELISKMRSFGIKNFVTTPHVLGDVYPNSTDTILTKLEEVKTALKDSDMHDVSIRAAAEYMLDEKFSEKLSKNDILTLKDNLILVEMSYFNAPLNLFDILFEIQLKGYKPLLAHPERYNFYHGNLENYYKLKKSWMSFSAKPIISF
jgi:protein-tyrosine phosphatase